MRDVRLDLVGPAIRDVSSAVVEPRYGKLLAGDVCEKAPDDLVTVADHEAERLLTRRLQQLAPGVPVVSEEAAMADPRLLRALGAAHSWVVDPIDGTAQFVSGGTDWGTMVALLQAGSCVASWIWLPMLGRMYQAERGAGAWRDGTPVRCGAADAADERSLRGSVRFAQLDPGTRAIVDGNADRFGFVSPGRPCAAAQYADLVEGQVDFVLFWRTWPWDHAPGSLLTTEAGGMVRRVHGGPFRPAAAHEYGLLAARDPRSWHLARQILAERPPRALPSTKH